MIKLFFYWLFEKSKTLKQLSNIRIKPLTDKRVDEVVTNIFEAMQVNQCKHLRRKWNRITENKRSPFYIYK